MRSTPCSGTALRTVCSGSVRGGSKCEGHAPAPAPPRRAEPPPPSGDGGTGLSVWSLPLPARPLACGQSPGPGLLGRGRSLWCMCAAAGPPIVAPSGTASRRCGAASAVAHFARRGRLRGFGPFAPSGASRP